MAENREKTVENGDSGSKTNTGSGKKWRLVIAIALLLLVGAVAAHAIIAKNKVCNKNLACDIYGTQTVETCPKTAKTCPKTRSCIVKEDSTKKCPLTEKAALKGCCSAKEAEKMGCDVKKVGCTLKKVENVTPLGCGLKEAEKTACTSLTPDK